MDATLVIGKAWHIWRVVGLSDGIPKRSAATIFVVKPQETNKGGKNIT